MRHFANDFLRWLSVMALAAACVGCGSVMTPAGVARAVRSPSWMASTAVATDLLYVSDQGSDAVYVYSYPFGKLVGTLNSLAQPAGICVDRHGNVWIVETSLSTLLEYAHGGKTAIRKIVVPYASHLFGCSVDATTGNLAVTDFGGGIATGDVLVYLQAKGQPKIHGGKFQEVYFCAYDDKGNLFVDGLDFKGAFRLAELPLGARGLKSVTLDQSITFPGGIEWDGKYVAIGDQEYQGAHTSAIDEVSVTGSSGTVAGVTPLAGSCDVLQFSIPKLGNGKIDPQGTRIIAPDVCLHNASLYKYPTAGAPLKTFGSFAYPVAAVVSK